MKKFICIDIGGTSIKYGVLNEGGSIITKDCMDTKALEEGGVGILEKIKYIVKKYINDYSIEGICISTAGMVDPKEGKIIYSLEELIPGYTGMEIKKEVEEEFKIRCEVENDVNCAGLGETWLGAGKGSSSAVCITIGTGIGGCVIINNRLISGFSNSAGEIGYMNVDGKRFQDLASTTSLVKRVAKAKGISEKDLNGKLIFEMAKNKDEDCLKEIDYMIKSLAIGIANLCYVTNPEVIILGGGIMAQGEFIKKRLKDALSQELIKNIYDNTRIEFAKKQNDAGMIGALYNFLNKI
ncbi:ROK family protein [Paraclostridium sordellii]|uniref:ROK family protein n=1 Tax=Paraclostridium sordellii TaxID=1505 RepID=UPI0005E51A88|nr:ROK family protein [Paeniclostridium sordellii]MCQ4698040.1 ROK family protein [Paeniclostridium sordellii]MDU4413937.1 ROK family protein [Paeniclostridium sordellii]MDU6481523.1 ROK family protein [Paeniclostridium sordellii]MRZ28940.1 ROK family protein [Paeniclostridium sordellii]MVO75227.1 ROK family protein [Paeniclostridium sordellii]